MMDRINEDLIGHLGFLSIMSILIKNDHKTDVWSIMDPQSKEYKVILDTS